MKRIYLSLTLLIMAAVTVAAQTSFKIIPPRNVVEGDRFQVTYQLENGEGSNLDAPAIEGCTQLYGPATSRQQSMNIVNGNVTSKTAVLYNYTYRADKQGNYTIPTATIVSGGKKYTAQAVTFTVLPPDQRKPSRPSSPFGGMGGFDFDFDFDEPFQQTTPKSKDISADDIFVRIILNKTSVYEQEPIECTVRLYTAVDIAQFGAGTPPTFDGFLIDEVNTQAALNNLEHYNGRNYSVADIKKCIIFPQKTGKLTINSGSYEVVAVQHEQVSNGYFVRSIPIEKEMKLRPVTATINVKPLPQPAHVGFNGAVGSFSISSDLSSSTLRTGEAASLTFTVKGSGNIKYLKDPEIDFPTEFEQYPPKQDIAASVKGSTVSGSVTDEFTFVPQTPGRFTIPAYTFVYFNPSTGKYEETSTPEYELNIAQGTASASATIDRQDIKIKNSDILHIHLGDKELTKTRSFIADQPWYWILYPLLLACFVCAILAARKRVRANADVRGRKASRAKKVAGKRLSVASKMMRTGNKEQFYDAILKAMWGYLSDKLSIPVSSLTRDNIAGNLSAYGTPQQLTDSVIDLLDECEMARYTPDSSAKSVKEIYDEASDLISKLQSVTKK